MFLVTNGWLICSFCRIFFAINPVSGFIPESVSGFYNKRFS
ncbi:hypothetical protein CIT292_07616 [Citrobacter youngae ATCC 29220]|uniref:Uncharacterized protein n=1 Tax=Citrobacter youngae ATCC 29220 TaxID=500640 RepID=D4BAX0_9ENTR|nr:hypothetical protein CIT292_07616 [Citrobacter youngae ATCC 29220]